ncbi:O-antigen ligase family protein [Vibrio parahaemolyticus]|nr:O-antigen ligase family protein [Vibrio parahaemolyticus]
MIIPIMLALALISPLITGLLYIKLGVLFNVSWLAISSLLLLLVFSRKAIAEKSTLILIGLMSFFIMWIIFTTFYTESTDYVYIKLIKTVNILIPFILIFYLDKYDVRKTIDICIVFNVIIGILYISSYSSFLSGNLDVKNSESFNTIYLNFGLLTGFISVASFVSYFNRGSLLYLIGFIILTSCLFFSGARGPLIISLSLSGLYLIFGFYKVFSFRNLLYIGAFSILAFYLLISFSEFDVLIERTMYRLSFLFSDDKGASINTRIIYIEEAVKYINENIFFGYGYGSYGAVVFSDDSRIYPHNIFFEVFFELGLIGVVILLLILLYVFFYILKNYAHNNNELLISFLGLIYFLINALKSNALIDHRLLFFFIILPFVFCRNRKS